MKKITKSFIILLILGIFIFTGYYFLNLKSSKIDQKVTDLEIRSLNTDNETGADESTPPNFKIAFIGDQGLGKDARAVLTLIQREGADMVLHQGDFDYENNPDLWDQQITDILGDDFPYFASIGNHDLYAWLEYEQKLLARLKKIDQVKCDGEIGVNSACLYQGIFFILSGAGTLGANQAKYIQEQLANTNALWRICSWHKNQRLMQIEEKENEVGWGPYEECRQGGAFIATGHGHSYARTNLMDNFKTQRIASTENTLIIQKGKTFVFVSGLGGKDIRRQNNELAQKPWWASIYTADQKATYGALFCAFNENGVKNKAHCYFKNINGTIVDTFDLISAVE